MKFDGFFGSELECVLTPEELRGRAGADDVDGGGGVRACGVLSHWMRLFSLRDSRVSTERRS